MKQIVFPSKSIQIGYSILNVSSENIHESNTIQTVQVTFRKYMYNIGI